MYKVSFSAIILELTHTEKGIDTTAVQTISLPNSRSEGCNPEVLEMKHLAHLLLRFFSCHKYRFTPNTNHVNTRAGAVSGKRNDFKNRPHHFPLFAILQILQSKVCPSVMLHTHPSTRLSVCLSVYLSTYVFFFLFFPDWLFCFYFIRFCNYFLLKFFNMSRF